MLLDDPAEWKRLERAWFKRLQRAFPVLAAIWKLELQERGAPHFHLIVFMREGVTWRKLRDFVAYSWHDVSGAKVTDVRTCYASKNNGGIFRLLYYLRKCMTAMWIDNEFQGGRVWGYRGKLPLAESTIETLSLEDWVEYQRRLRRHGRESPFFSIRMTGRGGFVQTGDPKTNSQLLRGLGGRKNIGSDDDSTESS